MICSGRRLEGGSLCNTVQARDISLHSEARYIGRGEGIPGERSSRPLSFNLSLPPLALFPGLQQHIAWKPAYSPTAALPLFRPARRRTARPERELLISG